MGEVFCKPLNVGEKAPSISLIRLENKEYFKSLELIGEKNLVLCFFSSWDKSFINTLPELIEISNDFMSILNLYWFLFERKNLL